MTMYYKYCAPQEHYFNLLGSRTIRVTQPAALNDPFEMVGVPSREELLCFTRENPSIIPGLPQLMADDPDGTFEVIQNKLAARNQELIAQLGVICVSSHWDIVPMWAHYCNNHTGFVIGFDDNVGIFGKMRNVVYSDTLPTGGMTPTPDSVCAKLHAKHSCWSYEKEHRVVGFLNECRDTGRVDSNGHRIYLHEIPKECITEINLGVKMTNENATRLVEVAKGCRVQFFRVVCDMKSGKLERKKQDQS